VKDCRGLLLLAFAQQRGEKSLRKVRKDKIIFCKVLFEKHVGRGVHGLKSGELKGGRGRIHRRKSRFLGGQDGRVEEKKSSEVKRKRW